jgi:hypothetical protein
VQPSSLVITCGQRSVQTFNCVDFSLVLSCRMLPQRVFMTSSAWFKVCWDWHAACCHCKDKPLKKTDFIMCLDWLHHEEQYWWTFISILSQEGFVTTCVINMIFLSCHHTLIWLSSCSSVHFNYSDYFDIVWAANNSVLFQFIQCRSTLQVMWAEKHAHTSYFYL